MEKLKNANTATSFLSIYFNKKKYLIFVEFKQYFAFKKTIHISFKI